MKVALLSIRPGRPLSRWHEAMAAGLARHGVDVVTGGSAALSCDVVAAWGWRRGRSYRSSGKTVICMERGYLGDRFVWTSLGINGLNGRGTHTEALDCGERFERHYGDLLKPWQDRDGYALILGQVATDAALIGVDIGGWYRDAAHAMKARGYEVRWRKHPAEKPGRPALPPSIAKPLDGTLAEALEGAAVAVTYNSNTGVDAVLAGVPTITCDDGAMARPVSAHGLHADLVWPNRAAWAHRLAWCQWSVEEIESGLAWEAVGPLVRGAA